MVSCSSNKENFCNNHLHSPCHKIVQNDEEGSEIEFEGWIQLGNPVREREQVLGGKCQRFCSMNSPNINLSHDDSNCCGNQEMNRVLGEQMYRNGHNHICPHNLNQINSIRRMCRCLNCSGRSNGCSRQIRNENEIYYVNNRQNPPPVVVQRPQTVVVRNRSRPPIVVQQPPPNVIVKNDPPQPIYVQNCPPNITVKNSEAAGFRNYQFQNNGQLDRGVIDDGFKMQSTCVINRNNQNIPASHRRNHCIYHCKHPCYMNL